MGCMVRELPFSAVTGKRHQLLLMTLSHGREREGGVEYREGELERAISAKCQISHSVPNLQGAADMSLKILHFPKNSVDNLDLYHTEFMLYMFFYMNYSL